MDRIGSGAHRRASYRRVVAERGENGDGERERERPVTRKGCCRGRVEARAAGLGITGGEAWTGSD